jgi:hypothetical protein
MIDNRIRRLKCLICHDEGVGYTNISDLGYHLISVHKIESATAAYFVTLQDKMEEGQSHMTEKQIQQKQVKNFATESS